MPSLSGAISDVAGSMRAVVGLSRPGRLRDQIDHTLDLFAKANAHDELGAVSKHLAASLEHQTEALANAVHPDSKRNLKWGPFAVALIFFVLPSAGLAWWGYQFTDRWWGWVWTVIAGMLTMVMVFAGFYALLSRDDD